MSTSTDANFQQLRDAIVRYADERGYDVADRQTHDGRSGLTLVVSARSRRQPSNIDAVGAGIRAKAQKYGQRVHVTRHPTGYHVRIV